MQGSPLVGEIEMTIKHPIPLNFICSFSTFCILTLVAGPLDANEILMAQLQSTEAAQSAETVKVKQTRKVAHVPVAAESDEAAQLRVAIKRCGTACRMGGAGNIAAPGGGTLDYECNDDGDCSCFGAKDCVAMAGICAEGSMGCNKQGCVCTEE